MGLVSGGHLAQLIGADFWANEKIVVPALRLLLEANSSYSFLKHGKEKLVLCQVIFVSVPSVL